MDSIKDSVCMLDEGPTLLRAQWWATYLLDLGRRSQYQLLFANLRVAQDRGCLKDIRREAEKIIKRRTIKGLKKARTRKSNSVQKAAA